MSADALSAALRLAAEAHDEPAAAELLMAGGYPRDEAEETAALLFRSLASESLEAPRI